MREQRRRLFVGALVVALVIGAGHGVIRDLFASASEHAALRKERETLAATVERLRMQLAVESAKRLEVERHAADLNAQVEELNGQVTFLRARKTLAKTADQQP